MRRGFELIALAATCLVVLALGVTQEVPLGSVGGRVTMAESGAGLPDASLSLTSFGGDINYEKTLTTKAGGRFELARVPAGRYEIEASARHHQLSRRVIEVAEGKATRLELEMTPSQPSLDLYVSQHVFTPGETPEAEVHAFLREPTLTVNVYRLDLAKVLARGGLQEALSPVRENRQDSLSLGSLVSSAVHPGKNLDPEGAFVDRLAFPKLGEGFYWVECLAKGLRRGSYLNVSRIALVSKVDAGGALCFVTDLRQGTPVPGCEVAQVVGDQRTVLGKTDRDGLARVKPSRPQTDEAVVARAGRTRVHARRSGVRSGFLQARIGDSVAFTSLRLPGNSGEDGEAGETGLTRAESTRIYTYTDRPIYRPGDLVRFKGIVRRRDGDEYRLPGQGEVTVSVLNSDQSIIAKLTRPLSPHGTFDGSFTTSVEAKPGSYQIVSGAFGAEQTTRVAISAYRKAPYTVAVKSERPHYVIGERAVALVTAKYYFGGPVAGAKVHAVVYRNPIWSFGEEGGDEGSSSEDQGFAGDARGFTGGEFSSEIDATTDESGVARIEFETKGKNDPNDMPTDFDYSVSVSIQEAGGQAFDGQGSVRVTRGDFSIHVEPDDYIVRPGSAVKCAVRVLGVDTPVKPGANRKVRLEIGTMHYDREKVEFERTSSLDGVTGVDGIATFTVPAGRHGLVALRAVIDDERGHRITDQSEFYVEGGTWPTWMDQGKLGVRFDKRQYDVGDIARVLIRTSKPGGVALLCVEGERLLESRIVKLGSETTTVELPVLKHDAPNATVSVVYIRAKQFSEQRAAMTVRQTAKQLTVEITPGKVSYHPGDTASVTVRTTNHAGKPVSAEVSVEVVDEAIYALAPESTNPERGLYPLRPDLVRTEYSFPEIYLDGGDKGTKSTAIRKRFQDTAYWAPFVQTGADGMARVSVPLPDNLTSWRTTAVAVSDDSAVGMSSANFRARKELMVRIETPSFLVAGDRQSIAVSVTNDDARDATIRLRMEAIGLTLPKSSDDLRVAAGKTESLHLDVAASRAGEASLTVTARSDAGASDGVRRTVTIQPHGRLVETMVGGMTQGSANLSFTLRQNADPNAGRLRVSFSPSIGGSLLRSLDRLVGFPYGCVEQTMSRFLPSVVVGKAFRDLGIHRPDLEARVPRIADDGFARLQKMQHSDGGWGWWTYDKSDPFMTALVLDGLARATEAGYPSKYVDVPAALKYGEQFLKSPGGTSDARIYLAYALARHGRKEQARQEALGWNLAKADAEQLSLAILAADALGLAHQRSTWLARLKSLAVGGEMGVHFPIPVWSWGAEADAIALLAIGTASPNDPMVGGLVRRLMEKRQDDGWTSTRDTAYAVIGLTQYLKSTGELSASPEVKISVNGRLARTVRLAKLSDGMPAVDLVVPVAKLRKGQNQLSISVSGGACYYSGSLRQWDVADQLPTVLNDSGLKIERAIYRMETRHLEDGTLRLMPSAKPVESVRSGDLLFVRVRVSATNHLPYAMIEIPIPSNCRIVDAGDPDPEEEWRWWWAEQSTFDDRAAFFTRDFAPGESELTFMMRAETPGACLAMPASVQNMYDPGRRASSAENPLRIEP